MSGDDADRALDARIERALRRLDVPDHAPGFWERVDRDLVDHQGRLGGNGAGGAGPGLPGPGRRRRRPPGAAFLVAATAAVVVLVAAAALLASRDGDRVEVGPAGRSEPGMRAPSSTTTTLPTTTTTTPSTPPTTSVPGRAAAPPGSEEAVLAFLDALGTGDLAAAAGRLGPRSEAYAAEAGGSVEGFLRQAEEGLGAWASVEGRTTRTVELGPGEVVVVVSGTVQVEGTVEHRDHAFPARYAESAGVWFVEPWAGDAADPAGSGLELVRPAPVPGPRPPDVDRIDAVEAATPGAGRAWLAVDGGVPTEVAVGGDGRAAWGLPDPLAPGQHLLVVAFADDGGAFAAVAASYVVAG